VLVETVGEARAQRATGQQLIRVMHYLHLSVFPNYLYPILFDTEEDGGSRSD
jgi:hypothetical protein